MSNRTTMPSVIMSTISGFFFFAHPVPVCTVASISNNAASEQTSGTKQSVAVWKQQTSQSNQMPLQIQWLQLPSEFPEP